MSIHAIKKIKFRCILVTILMILFVSCSLIKKRPVIKYDFETVNKLKIGFATKQHIKQKFGAPHEVKLANKRILKHISKDRVHTWCYKESGFHWWCSTFIDDVMQSHQTSLNAKDKLSYLEIFFKTFGSKGEWQVKFKPIRNPHFDTHDCFLQNKSTGWLLWISSLKLKKVVNTISRWNPKWSQLAPITPADTAPPIGDPNAPPAFPNHCTWLEKIVRS